LFGVEDSSGIGVSDENLEHKRESPQSEQKSTLRYDDAPIK